ncbi:MAG: hypothetical protein WC637_08335 [Victivallales bacterium]|jgi:hypothetical protein
MMEQKLTKKKNADYRWEFESEADRVYDRGYAYDDIGGIARQVDNNTLWILDAVNPTWRQLDSGGGITEIGTIGTISSDGIIWIDQDGVRWLVAIETDGSLKRTPLVTPAEPSEEGDVIDEEPIANISAYAPIYAAMCPEYGPMVVNEIAETEILSVKFFLKKYGTITGNMSAKIYAATAAGIPVGAALFESANVDVATLTTEPAFIQFEFTDCELAAGNFVFVLVFAGGDSTNHVKFAYNGNTTSKSAWYNAQGSYWTTNSTKSVYRILGNLPVGGV